jgi:hypothetical protein
MVFIEERAQYALEHAEDVEPRQLLRGLTPAIRLWYYPSFANYSSWTLFRPSSRGSSPQEAWLIRRIIWRRVYQFHAMFHTDPDLFIHTVWVPYAIIAEFVDVIVSLQGFHSYPAEGTGNVCDGNWIGIQVESETAQNRLIWWDDGSGKRLWQDLEQWQQIVDAVNQLRSVLEVFCES